MEIGSNLSNQLKQLVQELNMSQADTQEMSKEISKELLKNKMLTGIIKDIVGNDAKIMIKDGTVLEAKLEKLAQLNIGDEFSFKAEVKNGKFVLKTLEKLNDSSLLNELKADLKSDEALKEIIKNNIAPTKENLEMFTKGIKLNGSKEEVLFLIKNEMPITEKNISKIKNFNNQNIKLSDNLKEITEIIKKDPVLQEEVAKIIESESKETIKNELMKNSELKTEEQLFKMIVKEKIGLKEFTKILKEFDINKETVDIFTEIEKKIKFEKGPTVFKEIENILTNNKSIKFEKKELRNLIEKIIENEKPENSIKKLIFEKELIEKPEEIENYFKQVTKLTKELEANITNKEFKESITEFKNNIEFLGKYKNETFFMLPMNINDEITNSMVYVKNNKDKHEQKELKTALISVDTASLGKFLSYIKKNSNSISIDFKLENDEIVKLVKENLNSLENLLKKCNLTLFNVTFSRLEKENKLLEEKEHKPEIKITPFDMRM